MVNFAVSNLDHHQASLAVRGIETGETVGANKGVRFCSVSDPDNNTITFIGSFCERC